MSDNAEKKESDRTARLAYSIYETNFGAFEVHIVLNTGTLYWDYETKVRWGDVKKLPRKLIKTKREIRASSISETDKLLVIELLNTMKNLICRMAGEKMQVTTKKLEVFKK